MIRRFDRNGNNMIDPDEAQGPAQFLLQRMAQNNPKIDLSKPVPIDQLSSEMNRMRGGGSSSQSRGSSATTDEPELLVPDFSPEVALVPPTGFGAASALFIVPVEDRDLKEAEERLRRYDRDRNGMLSKEELARGRWSDDPMQYDRNRDGQLSASELAVRYANRRVAAAERQSESGVRDRGSMRSREGGWNRGGDRGASNTAKKEEEKVDRFGDAKSYRVSSSGDAAGTTGLPSFFARSDANNDGQVMMNEFSSSWNAETLANFLKWDLNGDGVILPRECTAALESGVRVDGGSSKGSSTASKSTKSKSANSGEISDADMKWARRQFGKYDKNSDGELTAKEQEPMFMKPTGADTNGDGVVSIEEYATFRIKKR